MLPYKPKIFVSSTIKDMPSERKAALLAIQDIGGEPIMSDYTINAQSKDSVKTCLEKVRESDFYILVLGGVYGWRPFGDKSITELEYQTAQDNNKPTLVFNTSPTKDKLQEEFSLRVGATYFWKLVKDAFELRNEMVEAIKEEFEKLEKNIEEKTETVFANLLEISFPKTIYIADLNIDRDEVISSSRTTKKWLKNDASWFDVAVSALHQKNIRFPHDWTIFKKQIITFHDLTDHSLPLGQICDLGTVEPISCDEFYSGSEDLMNVFKTLLAKCLRTKLFKVNIKWFKTEKLFAFMPTTKNSLEKWVNRKITWTRGKTVSRTVVKIIYGKKDPNKLSSARHLAFAAKFHLIDSKWYVSIKPDWLITWGNFSPSKFGFEKIQYLKRREKNIHVFNHLNFILWYLQPDSSLQLFEEYEEYRFLKIVDFLKFQAWPIINDDQWRKLESKSAEKMLQDKSNIPDLFAK